MTKSPRVTVIIPAFNEEATIGEVIQRLLAVPIDLEVIVVDDASTDETVSIARAAGVAVKVIAQEVNAGKGLAIRRALPEALGDIIAIQDADLEYFPEDLAALVAPFDNPDVMVVYGSRFKAGRPPMRWPNYVANRILAIAASLLFRARITDEATCYKLFRKDVLLGMDLQCHRFEFCPEATAKTLRQHIQITEIPIRYMPRTALQGKKITWRDGFEALWILVRYRLVR